MNTSKVLEPIFSDLISNRKVQSSQKVPPSSQPCPHCDRGFETAKDVNRHINGVHETTKRWFCTVARCRYSRSSVGPHRTFSHGKGFSRKDNWSRHMKNKHGVREKALQRLEKEAECV